MNGIRRSSIKSFNHRATEPQSSNSPLVSIITPTLNSEKYLEQTIKSVLSQTYPSIEYIIIDGGSTDGTLEIIEKYKSSIAHFASEPDRGIYDAMNKGVSAAKGELIGIINSDDWYRPEAVELIVSGYQKDREAGVCFGDIEVVSDKLEHLGRVRGRPELVGTYRWRVIHPSSFVARRVYEKRKYNIDFRLLADYDFFLDLYFSGVKFHYCNEVIAYARAGGKSSGYRASREEYVIRKKYFGRKYFLLNVVVLLISILKRFVITVVLRGNYNSRFLRIYRKMFRRR